MIKHQLKAYRKHFPSKWKKTIPDSHLDFNKFIYRNGHKIYTASCKEIQDRFKYEQEQFRVWKNLLK